MENLITLKNVSIGYKKESLLKNINLEINKGEYFAIIGPNGAGKSTLVKTILSVIPKISGDIKFKDKIKFGYVPQRKSIPDNYPLSAFDIVLMGRYKNKLFNKLTPKDKEIVKNNFDELNIKHLMKKQYSELSGGEKQRVLIAKALSIEPDILILDEPTSAMDLVSENNILKILENLNQNKKITIIMITHHLLHINANVTNLVFINKENNVFLSGKKEDVFTEEKLTKLYGNEITFKEGLEINIGEKWA